MGDATSVAAGELFALALRPDGTVWGWGYNDMGPLGVSPGTIFDAGTAVQIPGLTAVGAIAAKWDAAAALRGDGTVWTWGSDGQSRR